MLTRLIIRNFKRFEEVDVELGNPVVFIGPNNSGKTTALQALALWELAVRRWFEKRKDSKASKRTGVAINRKDILASPVPDSKSFWKDLHVRTANDEGGTQNIRIDIVVEGIAGGKAWSCGFEFDYQGEETLLFRPLRKKGFDQRRVQDAEYTDIPREVEKIRVAFLPPMSGLASNEYKLDAGNIRRIIGEGQTAQVLRNLCYSILNPTNGSQDKPPKEIWEGLVNHLKKLFGVELQEPEYVSERGEITMLYKDEAGNKLDLSMAGRGMQQTLLLLSYLLANPRSILLLDEPDAHLEILR